jgi:ubiquitin-activating enzyme E1
MEKQGDGEINTDLYSRQIGTFGMETMGKLIKMRVLIAGLRGLGVETAKNLILAGPKRVDIYDPTTVDVKDLGGNFYLQESDVGSKSRAEASVDKLKELNSYVKVEVVSDALTAEVCSNYDVVVFTELFHKTEDLFALNEALRAKNIGFILTQGLGAYGYTFVDYGDNFIVRDETGEDTKSFIVTSISNEAEPVVTVHDDKRHSFHDDSCVQFTEVQGMPEINNTEPIPISVIDGFSFKLKNLDTTNFGKYTREGLVENVKMPKQHKFNSLREALAKPLASAPDGCFITPDLAFFDRPGLLHYALQGILKFNDEKGHLPGNSEEDATAVINYAKEINEGHKSTEGAWTLDEWSDEIFNNAARYSQASISPVASFFGGVVAQEIVKYTGKYTPITQWFHMDFFKSLPKTEVNREPTNTRYDDQILVFGREVQEKLHKQKIFMVGAGALGCELIKAFALMGVGCSKEGLVSCTDNDNIEVSNLNRQFLFRSGDVGHSKSETACRIGGEMNPDFNVRSYQTLVGEQTESIFNDDFWESLDFVVNAVDNIKARLYVDSRCVWYKKPLLESGTLGTKANSQMIVPHMTQCYGDSTDPPEESIPMCTLRNFPNQIEHTIEWGRDQFNTIFTDRANDTSAFLENPSKYLKELKDNNTLSGQNEALTLIDEMIDIAASGKFEDCVEYACKKFAKNFTNSIKQLLHIFPKDYVDKDGHPFWSGPKRAPDVVELDPSDPLHLHFISACANLIAFNTGITQNRNKEEIAEMARNVKLPVFTPKTNVKIQIEDKKEEDKKEEEEETPEEEVERHDKLVKSLTEKAKTVSKEKFTAADFEKDDDTNFHIDFIHATANLRARNYRITECDQLKTKMIAGKIIPAIATTTAMIVGAVGMELYKVVQQFDKIEDYRNSFINLAIPLFVFTEPIEANKVTDVEMDPIMFCPVKAIPPNWTIWDTIECKGSKTVQEFLDWLKDEYKVDTTLLSSGSLAIYNSYLPGKKHVPRLSRKIEDIYAEIGEPVEGRNYLTLEVGSALIEDGTDVNMPKFKYTFA